MHGTDVTCYMTRSVHFDATRDQNTSTFLLYLKRLATQQGLPIKFTLDNGKTFKAASKYLKSLFEDGTTVKEYLVGTNWMFNVERAPWWGGAFERLVRSKKHCLHKFVGRAQFSFDELVTALAEIEVAINLRPLTYVSANDMEEPLTPSHLIVGRRILNLPDHFSYHNTPDDEEFVLNTHQLTPRMKHLASTLNHFWNRWRSEYLNELRETHSYTARKQTKKKPVVTIGDVVVIHNEHLPHVLWKLGKVVSVMQG